MAIGTEYLFICCSGAFYSGAISSQPPASRHIGGCNPSDLQIPQATFAILTVMTEVCSVKCDYRSRIIMLIITLCQKAVSSTLLE